LRLTGLRLTQVRLTEIALQEMIEEIRKLEGEPTVVFGLDFGMTPAAARIVAAKKPTTPTSVSTCAGDER
jgi:hypothetical protein